MNIVKFINENIPFTFVKFGDGEYLACNKRKGCNCDYTPYTDTLGNRLIESYKYLSSLSNCFIGKWETKIINSYFESLGIPNWVDYCSVIFGNNIPFNNVLPILKTIRNAKQQKIYVCNSSIAEKSKKIFNIDTIIDVHQSNWFEENYNSTLQSIIDSIIDKNSIIIMTSAGMGAKPLIYDLNKLYPNAILIDIGSAFDILSNKATRDYNSNIHKDEVDNMINLILS